MKITKEVKAKMNSYAMVTNIVCDIFNLDLNKDNIVVDADTGQPIIFNNNILKRHTFQKIANIRKGEMELDLLTGNTKILESLFEKYLENREIDFKGFGFNIKKGKKNRGTVDSYRWSLIIDNEEDDKEINSDYFKNKNLGLIQILLKLEDSDMTEDLNIIDR